MVLPLKARPHIFELRMDVLPPAGHPLTRDFLGVIVNLCYDQNLPSATLQRSLMGALEWSASLLSSISPYRISHLTPIYPFLTTTIATSPPPIAILDPMPRLLSFRLCSLPLDDVIIAGIPDGGGLAVRLPVVVYCQDFGSAPVSHRAYYYTLDRSVMPGC